MPIPKKILSLTALALGAIALIIGIANTPAFSANHGTADTIYLGGDILTMKGESPTYAEAVAVKDGKIVFVGDATTALAMQGPSTQIKDLEGNAMLPGFIDPHGHFIFSLNMVNQVNVSNPPVGPAVDIPSTIAAIQAFQAKAQIPEGGWIVGWGYDSEGLAEGRNITKFDLDEAFPNHKVVLIHVSGHGAVLNSMALASVSIDETTETPAGGIINRIPGTNEPEGLIMETAYQPLFESLPQPSESELLALMKPAQMMYASEGYTHAQEGFTHIKDLDFLLKAAEQDAIFLDIVSLPGFTEAPEFMNNPKYKFGEYHNGLKLQGIKFTQDGSPQGKTAYVTTPYLTGGPGGEAGWRGETTQPEADFIQQVQGAFDAGLQVFIHANGDATIDQAIAAVESAGITAADDRRTIVIHSQFQRPDQLPKYAALGMSPSYFTNHTFFWGDVHIKNIGREKADFISPIQAAKDQGIVFSNHTDFNVTPLDPFFVIWTAMARTSRTGEVLGADQRVDAYTALQGLTTGPAWQIFEENRKGMITEGMLADFVVLSADPVKTDVTQIRTIEVLETIKEDKPIYQAGTVSGTVSYRQRIALPPDAQLVLKLEDVSLADAPSVVITEKTIETAGQQVPIPFVLTYDPDEIQPQNRYAVRAQIFYGDQLRWTSTTAYPVITQDSPTDVTIQLEQVGGPG